MLHTAPVLPANRASTHGLIDCTTAGSSTFSMRTYNVLASLASPSGLAPAGMQALVAISHYGTHARAAVTADACL